LRLYEGVLRPLLFRLDAETAHELAVSALACADAAGARGALERLFRFEHPSLGTELLGLSFPNPVGLAAGFDKDCRLPRILESFGFGFLELGTVTRRPQDGNPRPRLFRYPGARALVNRMGFNGGGSRRAAASLARLGRGRVPLGINVGINKDVSPGDAPQAYARTVAELHPYGDYFALNVSSPNTPGLRRLQERIRLERILAAVEGANPGRKPVFVKLSPDLESSELEGLVGLLLEAAGGVICCNTTLSREGAPPAAALEQGGLSGSPLRDRSTGMIREVRRLSRGRLPIIGCGGIFSAEDAFEKMLAGASLVQVYTGIVYKSFSLVPQIKRGLVRLMRERGLARVGEAVGSELEVE
jgi:dihydroorotate dehydrogenase